MVFKPLVDAIQNRQTGICRMRTCENPTEPDDSDFCYGCRETYSRLTAKDQTAQQNHTRVKDYFSKHWKPADYDPEPHVQGVQSRGYGRQSNGSSYAKTIADLQERIAKLEKG